MNNKGFTLIELLGVIIILAVIAVITTPIVLHYITTADVASKKESAYGYIKAVDNSIGILGIDDSDRILNGTYTVDVNGNLVNSTNPSDRLEVSYKGDKPTGTVKISYEKVTYALLKFNKTSIKFENEEYIIQK